MSITTFIPNFIYQQFKNKQETGQFQGVALCVDIAGFPSLINNSIEHNHNARNAIRILNQIVLEPLVTEVEARGGILAYLDGRRVLAVFPYDNRETAVIESYKQALSAAQFVQAIFYGEKRSQMIENFGLQAKLALSSGEVVWGLPGLDEKFTYYFYGQAIANCLHLTPQAEDGAILVDEPFWQAVQPIHDQITAVTPEHPTIPTTQQITAINFTPPAPKDPQESVPDSVASAFISDTILNHLADTNAALHECSNIAISLKMLPTDENFIPFITEALRATVQFGGNFNQITFTEDGTLLSMSFGLFADGSEVKQAAECLRSIENSNINIEENPKWHAGLTMGSVWAGTLGAATQNRFLTEGSKVIQAEKFSAQAKLGEIWIDSAVYERLESDYRIDPLGTIFLDNAHEKSVPAYRLAGKRMLTQLTTAREIVGRQEELESLHEITKSLFDANQDSRFAGIAYVDGEAGIGKSHFIYAFQRELMEQHHIRWFYCPADAVMQQSLHPFKYALRQYFQQSGEQTEAENKANFERIFDNLVQRIPETIDESRQIKEELIRTRSILGAIIGLSWPDSLYQQLSPALRFENKQIAFKNFVKAEAICQPLVLQMEDSHWLDGDSRQLVNLLTHQMEDYPVAIISNARYDAKGNPYRFQSADGTPQHTLDLSYFSLNGTKELAEQVLDGVVTNEIAEFLFNRTHGNPFYIEQMALDLNERGLLRVRENGHRNYFTNRRLQMQQVPRSVNSLLITRLERMPTAARQIVQSAAILGQVFEIQVLSHMLQTEWQLPTKLEAMAHKQIWSSLGELQYLFKHALLWEAAYSMQPPEKLKERHFLAAEAIREIYADDLSLHYGNLAYHYQKAEKDDLALKYYRLGGEWAAEQYANEEAVSHYSEALKLTAAEDWSQQFDILLAREQIYSFLGERQYQKQDLTRLHELVTLADDETIAAKYEAEVSLRQSRYALATSEFDTALTYAETAVNLADQHGWELLKAEGLSRISAVYSVRSEYENSRGFALDAATIYQNNGQEHEDAYLRILTQLGQIAIHQGNYDQAIEHYQEALSKSREAGNRLREKDSIVGLGDVSWLRSEYAQGIDYYEQGLRICHEIGNYSAEGVIHNQLGLIYTELGNAEIARKHYEEGLKIEGDMGNMVESGVLTYNLASLLLQYQGEYSLAIANFASVRQQSEQLGHKEGVGYSNTQLGLVYRLLGQYETAEKHDQAAIDTFESINDPRGRSLAMRELAALYLVLGKLEEAESNARQAKEIADTIGEKMAQISANATLGSILTEQEQWAEAEQLFRTAMEIKQGLGTALRTLDEVASLANLFLKQGDLTQAKQIADTFIPHLTSSPDPNLMPYVIAYRVLVAVEDGQAAQVLQDAYMTLQARIEKIDDEMLRQSYLEQVDINREIVTCWEEMNQ